MLNSLAVTLSYSDTIKIRKYNEFIFFKIFPFFPVPF